MDLFTIENLCLAAEAIVVLLLIAFAWKPSRSDEHVPQEGASESVSWEPAKRAYLQNCIHRGLYLQKWKESLDETASDSAKPFPILKTSFEDDETLVPEPWQDRLTKLLNRQGFDAVINAWATIAPEYRGKSCLSMLAITGYSQIVSEKGAVTMERGLRALASHLSVAMANQCLVGRYQPDRFVILHFADSIGEGHQEMDEIQSKFSTDGFFEDANESIAIPCVVSIVDLSGEGDCNSRFDQLEEGCIEAEEKGDKVMSRQQGTWNSVPEETSLNRRSRSGSKTIDPDRLNGKSRNPQGSHSSELEETDHPTKEEVVSTEEPDLDSAADVDLDETTASGDISAVASAEDIEALYAQIKSKKNEQATDNSSAESKPVAEDTSNATQAPTVNISEESSDTASADDIAALFAAANQPKPAAPKPAAKSAPKVEEIDPTEAASADDIAALFAAANQPKAAAPKPAPAPAPPRPAPAPAPKVEEIDPTEAASADDIAALFAAANQPKAAAPKPAPAPAPPRPAPAPAPKVEEIDPTEAASADDIAALFAAANQPKAAAPKPAPAPAPPQPAPAPAPKVDAIDPAEPASADDIAALFAAANQPKVAPPQPTPKAEEQARDLKEADLSEAATEEDIAALFATVKAAAQSSEPTSDAAETAKPLPSGDELNETASLDDIEALFAAMKK